MLLLLLLCGLLLHWRHLQSAWSGGSRAWCSCSLHPVSQLLLLHAALLVLLLLVLLLLWCLTIILPQMLLLLCC